eukprot:6470748-Amphidinium_carterae.1
MSMDQLGAINSAFESMAAVRENTVADVLLPWLVPNLKEVDHEIAALDVKKALLMSAKDGAKAAVIEALVQEFYNENQYSFQSLFDMVTERMSSHEQQQQQQQP